MPGLGQDLRYVLRVLRRSPGFTLVAIGSLALGIGANTAMFGVVRALLLTPLPVEQPGQLRILAWDREGEVDISQSGSSGYTDPKAPTAQLRSNFSYPLYQGLKDATPANTGLFAFAFLRGVSVAIGDHPAVFAGGALADAGYFTTLRPPMALGRGISAEDDQRGAPLVAVLSHALWMRAFGGDPAILGRSIRVNGQPAEVIGVTAAGYKGLSIGGFFPQTEITLPVTAQPLVYRQLSGDGSAFTDPELFWLRLMVRLPAGAAEGPAMQALASALRSVPSPLLAEDGHLPNLHLLDGSQGAQPVNAGTARLLYFLLGVVGVVLLIACVNLASLMLARGVARQREMAVRRALGGGRARLLRQQLLEALVLALTGTVAGLVLSVLGRHALRGLLSSSLGTGAFGDVDLQVTLDPMVLGVSIGLAVLATLGFGLLPALRLTGLDPNTLLTQRGASAAQPRLTAGRALIALQIAISVPLVVGALLFLRTVNNLGSVALGFQPEGLVSFKVDPTFTRRPADQYGLFYQQLLSRVGEIPGVRSATLVENAPLSGIVSNSIIPVDGKAVSVYANGIGPGFLETMGARLLEGRVPGLQDGAEAPPVAVVNQKAVGELFHGASPIGRTLRWGGRDFAIIGVINDMPYRSARDSVPATFYPSAFQRAPYGGYQVFVRTSLPAGRLEPLLREAVAQVDPDVPVPTIRSQDEIIAQSSARERALTQLLTLFGGFALLLATIGLHGVTAYSVTRRTSEIGIRVALGAQRGQILWMVLRQVAVLALAGVALGIPAALAAAPLVGNLLYGVPPQDLGAIAVSAGVMFAVALAAGLPPARRAARVEPMEALRAE